MPKPFKPEGYNSLSAYLLVPSAAQTIAFLKKVLDAEVLRQFDGPDGRVMHAEVRIDDTVLMLAEGNEQWPPMPANIHIYVPDAIETYRKAIEAGAEAIMEPVQRSEDDDLRGGVRDSGGTMWWFANQV
ncbi:VOC family protein [Bremerella cremea]|uniref:VOC family protein n=1 Tax=Bremerella cremea TaxID=1031537 RepID=UPI0031F177EF